MKLAGEIGFVAVQFSTMSSAIWRSTKNSSASSLIAR
jgi:hypothetical protein